MLEVGAALEACSCKLIPGNISAFATTQDIPETLPPAQYLIQVSPIDGKATHVFYHIPVDKQFNATINEADENGLTIKSVPV
jgi:hypothetical protein